MNYVQLVNRIGQSKLEHRKVNGLYISEIPKGTPIEHAIEFIAFVKVAQKYREAYETNDHIPDDLTDEIFENIEELTAEMEKFK